MSTIGVKYHNEDIHNIIQKPMSPTVQSPRYKSKRNLQSDLDAKKKYNGHQTFGLAHYEAPESTNFLRKRKPKPVPPAVKLINKKEFKCTINCKSSPVPKHSFDSQKRTRKNFVKENIKKVLALEPKVPVPRRVDTPRGTTKELGHLLEMIKIRESDKYGTIPKYLTERREMWARERERREREEDAIREYKEKMGQGAMGMGENVYMIDKETRQQLLDGLKENWNELSKHFLKLPVMTDTWPKIKRKMWLEKEIEQLEKDVKLVESHPFIYLERSDRRSYEETSLDKLRGSENLRQEKERGSEQKSEKEAEEVEEMEKTEEKQKEEEAVEKVREEVSREEFPEEMPEEKKEEDAEINILNY